MITFAPGFGPQWHEEPEKKCKVTGTVPAEVNPIGLSAEIGEAVQGIAPHCIPVKYEEEGTPKISVHVPRSKAKEIRAKLKELGVELDD